MANLFCWRCRTEYPADTVICVRCGVNLKTGEEVPQYEEPAPELTGFEKVHAWIADVVPGLLRPQVLIGAIGLSVVALVLLYVGWMIFAMGAALSGIAIMAVAFVVYAQAVVWAITGQYWLLHTAMAEFQHPHWVVFVLATFGPGLVVISLLKILVDFISFSE